MRIRDLSEETTMKLDPAIMAQIITPPLERLNKVFTDSGFELRIVGGAVRDLVIGKRPHDVDLATNATPDEMINIFDRFKIRYLPTGLAHGTISALIDGITYEITTLRIDVETDGRHATVEYTRSFHQDAERRDFSYNAMSLGFDGTLYDYFDGLKDLKNGITKFVGNADARIKEDGLRILRFFRFRERMRGNEIDDETRNAIKNNAGMLKKISGERIWSELKKILEGPAPSKALEAMCELGVSYNIELPCRDEAYHLTDIKARGANAIGMLAFMLASEHEAEIIINRWKLSGAERDELLWLVRNSHLKLTLEIAENMAVYGTDINWINQLAILQNKSSIGGKILKWKIPTFPISGKDLLDLGIKAGPELGEILKKFKTIWVQSRFRLTREELLQKIQGLADED
jgi:tRNA nucleotidyltransferase (CCA-adding enzyme)